MSREYYVTVHQYRTSVPKYLTKWIVTSDNDCKLLFIILMYCAQTEHQLDL
jgi:hypothetical protein